MVSGLCARFFVRVVTQLAVCAAEGHSGAFESALVKLKVKPKVQHDPVTVWVAAVAVETCI